jgi:Xaa-Pro dipeptidase
MPKTTASVAEHTADRLAILPFAESVYGDRLSLVQADLRECGLIGGLLFNPENIYWLTGYQTIGYFAFHTMFVPLDGRPTVIAWVVNRDLALAHPTIGAFVSVMDNDDPICVLSGFLDRSANGGGAIGIETASWFLPIRDHARLAKASNRPLPDWNGAIESFRMLKSAEEVERIRRAARTAEAGIDAAIRAIAPGRTENDIASAMFAASIAAGSEYLGHPPLVVTGRASALCFAMWRRREIRTGDVVLLEAAGCIDRYHAMLSRPVMVGKPMPKHEQAADALRRALDAAVSAIRPGVQTGEVDSACRSILHAQGYGAHFWQEVGYSVGIGFPPNWSESRICSIRPGSDQLLQPGMTFHVIPTLFFEDFGMCFSDTVRVTETGCEVLTNYRRDFIVV